MDPYRKVESRRPNWIAEGTAVGAGFTLVLLGLFNAFRTIIGVDLFDLTISVAGAFFVLLFGFLLLRGIVFAEAGRRYSREDPPEYADWKETRRWRWGAAVTLSVSGMLLGASVLLWGWRSVAFRQGGDLLLLGTALVGILLYLYVFERIGVKIV